MVIDEFKRVLAMGDNYAGQLGTEDDIHRDNLFPIPSLAAETIVDAHAGF